MRLEGGFAAHRRGADGEEKPSSTSPEQEANESSDHSKEAIEGLEIAPNAAALMVARIRKEPKEVQDGNEEAGTLPVETEAVKRSETGHEGLDVKGHLGSDDVVASCHKVNKLVVENRHHMNMKQQPETRGSLTPTNKVPTACVTIPTQVQMRQL